MKSMPIGLLLAFAAINSLNHPPARAQTANKSAAPAFNDHQSMLEQLGITKLRPGKTSTSPNDEATANPYKDTMPDALTMKDGTRVTRAEQWPKRRAEILEDFEREIYGRIPDNEVTWEVTEPTEGTSGEVPTITKRLVGHVDNSAFPDLTVNIQASFTVPSGAKKPVPIMIEFGGFGGGGAKKGGTPPATAQPRPGANPSFSSLDR